VVALGARRPKNAGSPIGGSSGLNAARLLFHRWRGPPDGATQMRPTPQTRAARRRERWPLPVCWRPSAADALRARSAPRQGTAGKLLLRETQGPNRATQPAPVKSVGPAEGDRGGRTPALTEDARSGDGRRLQRAAPAERQIEGVAGRASRRTRKQPRGPCGFAPFAGRRVRSSASQRPQDPHARLTSAGSAITLPPSRASSGGCDHGGSHSSVDCSHRPESGLGL